MLRTLLYMMSLASSPALGGEFFISDVGDQQPSGPDIGGMNWIRVFNNFEDGGWWMTYYWEHEGVPGYNVAPMSEDLFLDISKRKRLAVYDEMKDHGIKRCPDGSFLHAYSLTVTNVSARAARYDSEWNILAEGWVEENVPERAHNDMPIICAPDLQAVAFTNHGSFRPTVFEIGNDAEVTDSYDLPFSGHVSGASWEWDPVTSRYLMIFNGEPGLEAVWLNPDLTINESKSFSVEPSFDRHFWPQALMRLGDYWVLGFLGTTEPDQYLAGDGDVYLAVLTDEMETLEYYKVSDNTDGTGLGSGRPGFARYRDQLLVSWDKAILPRVNVVTLNLVSFGLDEDDSGFVPPDTDDGDDHDCGMDDDDGFGDGGDDGSGGSVTGEDEVDLSEIVPLEGDTAAEWEDDDDCEKKCGCATGLAGQSVWWAFLAGLIGLRRRDQSS